MIYYDEAERRRILSDYAAQVEALDRWYTDQPSDDEATEADLEQFTGLLRRVDDLSLRYMRMTPVVPLSRCPISGEVVYHSIDHYGLDGPWWDYMKPLRPVEDLPATFFTLTGSLKLNGPAPRTTHQVRPGPEAPYVVRQVIERPGIKAVISRVQVGEHTGHPVFYFSEDVDAAAEPTRIWGSHMWQRMDRYGRYVHVEPDESGLVRDYDLRSWVEDGKLFWIEPGDETFTLRSGVGGCPYLGVGGGRKLQIILDGVLTYQEEE